MEEKEKEVEEKEKEPEEKEKETERKAFVPKIYIKKPLAIKETEKPKEVEVNNEKKTDNAVENKVQDIKKPEESKANGEENKPQIEEEKSDKTKMLEKLKETLERSKAAKDNVNLEKEDSESPNREITLSNDVNKKEVVEKVMNLKVSLFYMKNNVIPMEIMILG